jgi:hypothetical protein
MSCKNIQSKIVWLTPLQKLDVLQKHSKTKCGPSQPLEPHGRGFSLIRQHRLPEATAMSVRCHEQRNRDDDHRSDSALSSAAFTCTDCMYAILWIEHCKRAVGQQPNPLIEREVEEAAMPGHRPALSRLPMSPGNSPSRIASCHQRHRDLSFDGLESSHVFAEPTLRHNVANGNSNFAQACAEAVEDETSLWKAEENCGENLGAASMPSELSIT